MNIRRGKSSLRIISLSPSNRKPCPPLIFNTLSTMYALACAVLRQWREQSLTPGLSADGIIVASSQMPSPKGHTQPR